MSLTFLSDVSVGFSTSDSSSLVVTSSTSSGSTTELSVLIVSIVILSYSLSVSSTVIRSTTGPS